MNEIICCLSTIWIGLVVSWIASKAGDWSGMIGVILFALPFLFLLLLLYSSSSTSCKAGKKSDCCIHQKFNNNFYWLNCGEETRRWASSFFFCVWRKERLSTRLFYIIVSAKRKMLLTKVNKHINIPARSVALSHTHTHPWEILIDIAHKHTCMHAYMLRVCFLITRV